MFKFNHEDENEKRVLKDGERLRVPLNFMDSQQRAVAQQTVMQDAQDRRDAAYDAMVARLDPTTPAKTIQDSMRAQQPAGQPSAADVAYDRYCDSLRNHYRGATA